MKNYINTLTVTGQIKQSFVRTYVKTDIDYQYITLIST